MSSELKRLYHDSPVTTFEAILTCQNKECDGGDTIINSFEEAGNTVYEIHCQDCGSIRILTPDESDIIEDFLGL